MIGCARDGSDDCIGIADIKREGERSPPSRLNFSGRRVDRTLQCGMR